MDLSDACQLQKRFPLFLGTQNWVHQGFSGICTISFFNMVLYRPVFAFFSINFMGLKYLLLILFKRKHSVAFNKFDSQWAKKGGWGMLILKVTMVSKQAILPSGAAARSPKRPWQNAYSTPTPILDSEVFIRHPRDSSRCGPFSKVIIPLRKMFKVSRWNLRSSWSHKALPQTHC